MDSPLSEATGSRVGLLRQGGAPGRRAKAHVGQRDRKDREPGTGTQQGPCKPRLKEVPSLTICVKCFLGSELSKAEAGPFWAQNNKGGGRVRIKKKKALADFVLCLHRASLRLDVGAEA